MIDTYGIFEALASTFDDKTAKTLTGILTRIYTDVQQMVTHQDFDQLRTIVAELAEAQRHTEQRLSDLAEAQRHTEQRLSELAEAQRHTEQRLSELAEAQRHTEQELVKLTEAQKRTEQRVEELAEAQKRSEGRIDRLEQAIIELTEAQRQTENSLNALIKRVDKIEERLEGISDSVGYSLENNAYRALPKILANQGIHVKGRLIRRYIDGYQVNIFGTAQKGDREVQIFGECKTRPSKKEIDRFMRIADKICKINGYEEKILLVVAHDYHPAVERYLSTKDIMYFWSYELESD